jgi:hypothetical protein
MMATFIAQRVIAAAKTSLVAGRAKYQAYFIATTLYLASKNEVDSILTTDGYTDCIVAA